MAKIFGKNVLERPKHALFLNKVRNCAPTFSQIDPTASCALAASTDLAASSALTPSDAPTDAVVVQVSRPGRYLRCA